MRIVALALTVPPLIAALLVAALIATAMPAPASQPTASQPSDERERTAQREACMREMRRGLKAGQRMTNGQRMLATEQCRGRIEAATAWKTR